MPVAVVTSRVHKVWGCSSLLLRVVAQSRAAFTARVDCENEMSDPEQELRRVCGGPTCG